MADFAASWVRLVEAILNRNTDPATIIPQIAPILSNNEWLYLVLFRSPHLDRFIKSKLIPSKVAYQYFTLNLDDLDMFVRIYSTEQVVEIIKEILSELDKEQHFPFLYYVLSSFMKQDIPIFDFSWVTEDIKADFLESFFFRFILSLDFLQIKYQTNILSFLEFYLKERGLISLISKIREYFDMYFPYLLLINLLYPFKERILHELLDAMDRVIESGDVGTPKDTIGPILEYFNNVLWLSRNEEYRKKLTHFESIAEYKEAYDRRKFYESFIMNSYQSVPHRSSEEFDFSYLLFFVLFNCRDLFFVNWPKIEEIFGIPSITDYVLSKVKLADKSKLLKCIEIFWHSFYYSRNKKDHVFNSLLFFLNIDRREEIEEILIEIVNDSSSFAVPVIITNEFSEALKILYNNTKNEINRLFFEEALRFIESNDITEPKYFFFRPVLNVSLINDRSDFEDFQEFALALLYHLRFQLYMNELKKSLRAIVFQRFMNHHVDVLLDIFAVEFNKHKAEYFNYFLIEPKRSLEVVMRSLVYKSELIEEQDIIARLSLIAELFKQYPDLSIEYIKEEFCKATNLFRISISIILKYIFKIHKLDAKIKQDLSNAFKSLLRDFYDTDLMREISDTTQLVDHGTNPYGMVRNPQSEKSTRKHFDPKIIFSFYNSLFIDGKRIFHYFPKENLTYYEKKNISKTHMLGGSADTYIFPNLSIFSENLDQDIFYNNMHNHVESNDISFIDQNEHYGFPSSAGEYTMESYFTSFTPRTVQTQRQTSQPMNKLSFHMNFPLYTQNIYLKTNPPRGYQDFSIDRPLTPGVEKLKIEDNYWSFNLNASMRNRLYSDEMQRFLTNFRWTSHLLKIDDVLDEDDEVFLEDSNSRYLSEIAKFIEMHPLYLGENSNSIYTDKKAVNIPSRADLLGLYNYVITELNQMSIKDIVTRFHCSRDSVQQLILHQFTLWIKLFGYFTDSALYHVINANPDQFSYIAFLGQKGKFNLCIQLYEALFEEEDARSEIMRILERESNGQNTESLVIIKDKQDSEKPDSSLTDDLLL